MQILDTVRDYGLDIQRTGTVYKVACPFHEEFTPSLALYPDTNSFYCFGCHIGGGVVEFVANYEGISRQDVKKRLSSVAYLKDRLDRLAEKKPLDFTKETAYLVSQVVFQAICSKPHKLLAILETLQPYDAKLAGAAFEYTDGIRLVEELRKDLYKIMEGTINGK